MNSNAQKAEKAGSGLAIATVPSALTVKGWMSEKVGAVTTGGSTNLVVKVEAATAALLPSAFSATRRRW